MKRCIYTICIAVLSLCSRAQAAPPEARLPEEHRAFFKAHCLDCHDSETREGKVDLETLSFSITTIEQAELWQKVLNALNSGEMPPEDSEQPGNTEKADFLDDLARTMVTARQALSDSGGKITMRRLNRREYRNTIQQLTGVKVDVDSLPTDGGSGTFDTVGASQFISSDQFEQYLKLGRSAIDEAFERQATAGQPARVFRVEPENTINRKSLESIKGLEKSKDNFLRWKAEVDKAIADPRNKEIMARLLKENPDFDPATFPAAGGLRFYRNASELIGAPNPKDFGYLDDNKAVFSYQSGYSRKYTYLKHYSELPHNDRGAYLKLAWGIQRFDLLPDPKDVPPGTYKLRIRAGTVEGSDPSRHFIEVGHPQRSTKGVPSDKGLTGAAISSHQVTGTIKNPSLIEITVEVGADTPREFGIQESQPHDDKALLKEYYRFKKKNGYGTPPAIWIDWFELEGPITEAAATESRIVRIEPEKTINPDNEKQIAQIEDAYARFSQWQKGVDEVAKTAANQARIAQIRKTEPKINHPQWFYSFADRLEGTPDPRDFGFRDSQKAAAAYPAGDRSNLAYHKHYLSLPHRDRGAYLKLAHGTGRVIVSPKKLPAGNYIMRVRVGAVEDTPPARRFIQVGHPQRLIESRNWGLEGPAISTHQVSGTIENPETIEIPLEVGADTIREFAVQEKQPNNGNLKALWDAHNQWKKENGYGHPPAIWIDWVELEGPHWAPKANTQSPLQLVLDRNSRTTEQQRARAILTDFASAAFREVKPEAEFIDRLVAIYETRRKDGDSFDIAIRTPLSVILASPGFLYLGEPGDESDRRQLNDRELAVRLSYFLWSGPPDAELLQLAEQNRLHFPEVLRQQVDRLIADPRSDDFVAGFVHQWLDMERLDFFQFDVNLHRDFDESTRSATREEVYQSFSYLLRTSKDGRLGKLLKSDYVFVNGLLATYYGIEGVTGDEFRKIQLPTDSPRGGLLGMAAIHAMGSDGVVSSPVERGAWVLRHLLNDPPPPAPPNVPQISRLEGQILTTRERLLAHQEEAQCASCHRKIDPIGFGLENFNAAGKWRTEDSYQSRDGRGRGVGKRKTWRIDASGAFHKGPVFNDYRELRDLIAERESDFARGFTEHLIEYALGRPFGFTDEDLANEIVNSARSKEFAVSEFIHSLVQSKAFQKK